MPDGFLILAHNLLSILPYVLSSRHGRTSSVVISRANQKQQHHYAPPSCNDVTAGAFYLGLNGGRPDRLQPLPDQLLKVGLVAVLAIANGHHKSLLLLGVYDTVLVECQEFLQRRLSKQASQREVRDRAGWVWNGFWA